MYSESIARSLQNFKTVFSDKDVFNRSFFDLQQVVACRVIGDDIAYNKFLSSQINNKDDAVLALQDSVSRFPLIKQYVTKLTDAFQLDGFVRVANTIRFVTSSLHVTRNRGRFWSMCQLIGPCV